MARRSGSRPASSVSIFGAHQHRERQLLHRLGGQRLALAQQALAAELVEQVGAQRAAEQHLHDALLGLLVQDADLVLLVLLHGVELFLLDRLGPVVLLDALAGEDLDADDDALDARRADQRGVADVAGLLAEDGPQQLFFRGQLGLALGRDLADQDVARLDVGADADDAAVVEIAEVGLRDVGDVAGDFLGPELGVAGLDLELLDVDRGVVVLFDRLLGHQDGVLEVVAAPRHEGDQHVAAEGQLAQLGAGPVGQHLALVHPLPHRDDRLLVDAGVLVRALELGQGVDVGPHLLAGVLAALDADDDAGAVDEVDGARCGARRSPRPSRGR